MSTVVALRHGARVLRRLGSQGEVSRRRWAPARSVGIGTVAVPPAVASAALLALAACGTVSNPIMFVNGVLKAAMRDGTWTRFINKHPLSTECRLAPPSPTPSYRDLER
jgi:hypothetical protein